MWMWASQAPGGSGRSGLWGTATGISAWGFMAGPVQRRLTSAAGLTRLRRHAQVPTVMFAPHNANR
jgi:hypothetical protein